jgi:hypothetical protein
MRGARPEWQTSRQTRNSFLKPILIVASPAAAIVMLDVAVVNTGWEASGARVEGDEPQFGDVAVAIGVAEPGLLGCREHLGEADAVL